jgi:type IV pilus assembly protein PilC
MSKFTYTALDPNGKRVSGTEENRSAGAVNLALIERGLQPLSVSERRSIFKYELTKKRVARSELMRFSRHLSVFVKAGIPILEGLEIIADETTDKLFKKALQEMIEALRAGDTFAGAAAAHPEVFPAFYLGILNSAELTGSLDVVLLRLAEYLERDEEARRRLVSALIYPAVVMGMSIVTVIILVAFVLPRFETFFKSLNAKLPLPTRLLLSATHDITTYWYVIAGLLVGGGALMAWLVRSKTGRPRLDALVLKLPIMGDLIEHAILERICRILASMMSAGVALTESIVVTSDAANNAVYRRGLNTIREEMLEGQGLAGPIARSGLFPGAAQQIFRVGEETGTLDTQLKNAAEYYDRELDVRIKRFTSLFEPAVIIFMGVIVGFVAVALVSAMYGIYRQVKVT